MTRLLRVSRDVVEIPSRVSLDGPPPFLVGQALTDTKHPESGDVGEVDPKVPQLR